MYSSGSHRSQQNHHRHRPPAVYDGALESDKARSMHSISILPDLSNRTVPD